MVIVSIFSIILYSADPDPIYLCEVLDICPHTDGGKVSINNFSVSPQSGTEGTLFTIQTSNSFFIIISVSWSIHLSILSKEFNLMQHIPASCSIYPYLIIYLSISRYYNSRLIDYTVISPTSTGNVWLNALDATGNIVWGTYVLQQLYHLVQSNPGFG